MINFAGKPMKKWSSFIGRQPPLYRSRSKLIRSVFCDTMCVPHFVAICYIGSYL